MFCHKIKYFIFSPSFQVHVLHNLDPLHYELLETTSRREMNSVVPRRHSAHLHSQTKRLVGSLGVMAMVSADRKA